VAFQALSFNDLEFLALAIMTSWVPDVRAYGSSMTQSSIYTQQSLLVGQSETGYGLSPILDGTYRSAPPSKAAVPSLCLPSAASRGQVWWTPSSTLATAHGSQSPLPTPSFSRGESIPRDVSLDTLGALPTPPTMARTREGSLGAAAEWGGKTLGEVLNRLAAFLTEVRETLLRLCGGARAVRFLNPEGPGYRWRRMPPPRTSSRSAR
jgi:hypothetical protein